jgi:hypothetical protein
MPIASPVIRLLPLLTALCLCSVPLCAQVQPEFPIQSSQSEPADQVELPITTEHLTGVLVSAVDGSAIAHALVTSTGQRFAAFTDSQGRFSFDLRRTVPAVGTLDTSAYPAATTAAPSSMNVSFMIRKPGYVSVTSNFQLAAVQPDSPEAPLTLKIVPTGFITGHIYAESGDVPDLLKIQLLRKLINNGSSTWVTANTTSVNNRGEFRFADLEPGDYKLFLPAHIPDSDGTSMTAASISGFLPEYYPNGIREDSAAILSVGAGASVTANLNLHAAPFYDVTIPVANPEKGFTRAILIDGAPGLSIEQSNQNFEGHLPDGTYNLLIYSNEPRSPSDPNPLLSNAFVKIEVRGKAVHTAVVALHPTPEVPIVVRREFTSSQPQPPLPPNQLSINLFLQNVRQDLSEPAPSVTVNSGDGSLSLVGVMPGTYTVTVSPRITSAYIASATSGTTDLLREPFQVVPNSDPRPIEVTLRDDSASIDAAIAVDPATPSLLPASPAILLCIPLDRPQSMPGVALAQQSHASVKNLAPGRYLLIASRGQVVLSLEYNNADVLRSLMQKGTVVTLSPNQTATVQVPLMPDGDN